MDLGINEETVHLIHQQIEMKPWIGLLHTNLCICIINKCGCDGYET